jgi:two-component system chemotaxis response regulator CheY
MANPTDPQTASSAGESFSLERVLIVDDEPLILLVVAGFLAEHVGECVEAESGAEALNRFQPGAFDLVITDRTMPGMDGLALTREIKQRHPTQKVLLISGVQAQGAYPPPSEGGPDAFLAKPFTRAGIIDCVANLTRTRA